MTIEDELRGALDVAAPPARTTLDEVMKRGRRRVFAQRVGAVLGVVTVVAGVGFSAASLNSADPTPATPPTSRTEPAPSEQPLDWPRVNLPPQASPKVHTPDATAPPPPGRAILRLPVCERKQSKVPMVQDTGTVIFEPELLIKLQEALLRHRGNAKVGGLKSEFDDPIHYLADVSDERGTGSVIVFAGRYTGTPLAAADAGVWETGDCNPPYRRVLANGTIVQLHEVHIYGPFQLIAQRMVVYRPDGLMLKFELRNFGTPDLRRSASRAEWEFVGTSRETLPMTQQQFAALGLTVAEGA